MSKQGIVAVVKPLMQSIALAFGSASLIFAQEASVSPPLAAEAEVRFDIWEYRVLGNTTLPSASIERALYEFTGPSKVMSDVESARQALEKTYHDAGYGTVYVDIPEQAADEGIVRLRVTEGRLDRVRVTGARYFSNKQIRAALPALQRGDVPLLPNVQAQLADLNRMTPDRSVVPVLKAGSTPGTVDVDLKVTDELPLHGSLELNDRYSPDTTRLRALGSLSYDNLFQSLQSFSLQYQTAPEETDDVEAFVASYVFRMPTWRTTVALYGVDSNTDVAAFGTLGVLGKGQIFGVRIVRALPDLTIFMHGVSLGLDYKDFQDSVQLSEGVSFETPISYLNWSLSYNATRYWTAGSTAFDVAANWGVRGSLNASEEFEAKRSQSLPNYFYLRGSVHHTQDLPNYWQLFGKLSGQATQDSLVSNEQFAIGGADTVRAYLESSVLGDYGVGATMELRSTILAKWLKRPTSSSYFLAFYDLGVVSILEPLPGQIASYDIASVGAGMRIRELYGFQLAIDWANALKEFGDIREGDQRVHFSVRYEF